MNNLFKDYFESQSETNKVLLKQLRQLILEAVPEVEECISYGMPTFKYKNKNFVHIAGYKNHIGFYPTPAPLELLTEKLKGYKYSKGAIQFPNNKDLPVDLIKELLKFRLSQF